MADTDKDLEKQFERVGIITELRGFLGVYARRGCIADCKVICDIARMKGVTASEIGVQSAMFQARNREHYDVEMFLAAWLNNTQW